MVFGEFKGTPREIGIQKGKSHRERITAWVAGNDAWWRRDWGATDETLKPVYERLRENSAKMYPELLQEMDGIAEGAGLTPQQVLLQNHYAYLWGTMGLKKAECSTVGYVGSDKGPILGQNLDIGEGDWYYCELSRPTTGYAVLSDGWYGMCFGDTGVNEHGLAVGTSHLSSKPYLADWTTGIHVHFFARLILRNCRNVREGIAFLREHSPMIPLSHGKNYLLVDWEGDMAVVERMQDTVAVRREHKGAMAATNFCLHPEAVAHIPNETEQEKAGVTNARGRHDRLIKLFEDADRRGSLELMQKSLRWHEMPGAICRHAETDPAGYSRLSLIALPHQRKLLVTDGLPCKLEYETFQL
jgi:isopenicillin-N N-acyltransferase like protein